MHKKIQNVCDSLKSISVSCKQQSKAHYPQDQVLSQQRGWHHPSLTGIEIAEIPNDLANKIEDAKIDTLEDLDESLIDVIPARLQLLSDTQNILHIFNGNAQNAFPAFISTINWVENIFEPALSIKSIERLKVPTKLRRKVNKLQSDIEALLSDTTDLESIISTIREAHESAENLPADHADLKQARREVEKTYKIIEEKAEKVTKQSGLIQEQSDAASVLIDKCEKAYSSSVTKGLASAFQDRAKKLSISMYFWVFGLLVALSFGVFTGGEKLKTLSMLISEGSTNIELISIQLILALISLGAPIWFAWLSTKQIGQNFRLAEDYNFKASMAKAYEGYRREAARIDPVMEAKLLYSALNRLDEAPLRYVDDTYHATPWQELISSQEFRQAMENVPEFKTRFMNIVSKALPEKFRTEITK